MFPHVFLRALRAFAVKFCGFVVGSKKGMWNSGAFSSGLVLLNLTYDTTLGGFFNLPFARQKGIKGGFHREKVILDNQNQSWHTMLRRGYI
jgi:hypothetical protein